LPHADPVEKISIVRRWHALWVTWIMPNEDMYLSSKVKFLDEVVSLLWWRAAEEVFFGSDNITTWASNDFEKATDIITNMIVKYGMDNDLGTVTYLENNKNEYSMFRWYSEKTAQIIDEKIKKYMADCYAKSKQLIIQNKWLIEKLSVVLLDKEYLSKDEFESMINNFAKAKRPVIKKIVKKS
jgi:ATP-dependent Zn protease